MPKPADTMNLTWDDERIRVTQEAKTTDMPVRIPPSSFAGIISQRYTEEETNGRPRLTPQRGRRLNDPNREVYTQTPVLYIFIIQTQFRETRGGKRIGPILSNTERCECYEYIYISKFVFSAEKPRRHSVSEQKLKELTNGSDMFTPKSPEQV